MLTVSWLKGVTIIITIGLSKIIEEVTMIAPMISSLGMKILTI